MCVEIRARNGELNRTLKEQVERRLRLSLGRFSDRIRQVRVLLTDLNGPRGGIDQHCRIEVSLVPSGTVMAEATDAGVILAIGRAAKRIVRQMRDKLERRRTSRVRIGATGCREVLAGRDRGPRSRRGRAADEGSSGDAVALAAPVAQNLLQLEAEIQDG